ncbi:FAD-dependent oxidoreductase [Alkalihalobacterium bogoriense]|uniref:FAD-dependent oxidoreductase n=1 Tax=Alkalihalobacterium bogoriense TaxID=246272 RepID=UPI000478A468|nr:FAD-dependent oxidoreductase [Alkalihalobacterium bogoriense]
MSGFHQLPSEPEPYWRESITLESFPKLNDHIETDVAIVGGGIVGITTAYLLSQQGLRVTILEAGKLANGTTGHTTAKITSQHGLIYDEFIEHFGEEKAKMYYEANEQAKHFIESIVSKHNIDCQLKKQEAYVYTNADDYMDKLEKEWKAYQKLGIPSEFVHNIPVPVDMKAAIMMKNQAQFHPLQYLSKLIEDVKSNGHIYEQTTVIDLEEGERPIVMTEDGYKVSCKYVIAASHFPFKDGRNLFFSRLYPYRSYIVGVKIKEDYPGGMYINAEKPSRSLRSAGKDDRLVLVSGEEHKTGQGISMLKHYEALETYAKKVFDVESIPYRWSAQDYTTADKMPYVGQTSHRHENVFVATGFRKWGMTNSTNAALLLTDLIINKENPFVDLFSPNRFVADPSVRKIVKENADVAAQFIKGKLDNVTRTPDDLGLDEGAPVHVNGKRCGGYKDKEGNVTLVDTTCTHMYCEVEWNSGDRTWDCPCHGSRFSIEGEVIEGPAKKPLTKIL